MLARRCHTVDEAIITEGEHDRDVYPNAECDTKAEQLHLAGKAIGWLCLACVIVNLYTLVVGYIRINDIYIP